MMGRISRLNLTGSAPAVRARQAISRTVRSGCMWNMLQRGGLLGAGIQSCGPTSTSAWSGSWRTRADLEVRPTTALCGYNKMMSSVAGVSVEEYLSTAYRPACDYVNGEVRERNVGEYAHSNLQGRLVIWLGNRERDWNIRVLPEQRVRVSSHQFRVPDLCVLRRAQPMEPVFTQPPLICIEILSKDDRVRDMRERVDEYLNFGVPNVWILDPVLRKAYVCTQSRLQEPEGGIRQVAGSTIRVPLAEVFAELDQ